MPKICFAIPTWNRAAKLKRCVESIAQEIQQSGVDAAIHISDNCSNDETALVTQELADRFPFVSFSRRPVHAGMFDNLADATEQAQGDYIWWFGDDDQLLPGGLEKVAEQLRDVEVAYIAAGNGWFKPHSGKVVAGELLDLCNHMGWNQVIGWITGDVLRQDIAQKVCHLLRQEPYKLDAYAHVGAVLTVASELKAIHIDHPIVQPMGHQDKEDMERWAKENVGWRYFLLIETFKHMFDQKILTRRLKPKFFKYLNFFLWDRFIVNMISSSLKDGGFPDKGWDMILWMAEMVDDLDVRKSIRIRCQAARLLCMNRKALLHQIKQTDETLVGLINEANRPVFSLGTMT
jgi:abequosyltransferase